MQKSAVVKLISLTKPVGEIAELTPQELVAYTARVSNPTNQMNNETASKLLKYCIKNKHWSIFEQVDMCVEIVTSRAIAQQILRHRSFTFQEFSQRYAQATDFITYPARRQDVKNRQNSVDDMSTEVKEWFEEAQLAVQNSCNELYTEALEKGIAKEQARFLLPLSTQTKLYMKGSLRSWIHYIDLRASNGTQQEHREIAEQCKSIFAKQFPDIAEALEWSSNENID